MFNILKKLKNHERSCFAQERPIKPYFSKEKFVNLKQMFNHYKLVIDLLNLNHISRYLILFSFTCCLKYTVLCTMYIKSHLFNFSIF